MKKEEFELEKKLAELKHKFMMEEIEAKKKAQIEVENLSSENDKSLWRLKRADRKRESQNREDFGYPK